MKDILAAPFVEEMRETTANMYYSGWDERNEANISLLLNQEEEAKYLDITYVLRTIPIGFEGKTTDETFGLIETVEKAAQIYMLTAVWKKAAR